MRNLPLGELGMIDIIEIFIIFVQGLEMLKSKHTQPKLEQKEVSPR